MGRRKQYIPKPKFNPVIQAKKIEEQALKVEEQSLKISNLDKAIKAISKSHDTHISYLGNFARHDVKNSIQSMDSVLSTNRVDQFTEEHILSLKQNLKSIRETMDNFSKLVPYSSDEKFSLKDLFIAVEVLSRSTFHEKKIDFIKDFPEDVEVTFNLPFQSILQMLNNLIINSIKSLESTVLPQIKICAVVEKEFYIEVSDNGSRIEEKNSKDVFEFGYSTTGGSGIGLYHAKYLCDLLKGKIELVQRNDGFSKSFKIYLPIINQSKA